jgi:hypothetical protein
VELLRKKIHSNFKPTRGAIDPRVLKIVGENFVKLRTPKNANVVQMLRGYVRDIRAYYKQKRLRFCPSMIAANFIAQFAPSSAHNYMVNVQTHIHPEFKSNRHWRNMMDLAQTNLQLPPAKQATPTTPQMIRRLIGNLSNPCQLAIFQIYTTASRFSESRPSTTPDGHVNLNVWKPSYFKKQRMVRLFLRTHKAASKGQRPYSKWIKVRSKRHANLYLKNHNVEYFQLLNYIKQRYPNLSVHSLRRGALHRLQFLKFQPKQLAILSGHNDKTKIPTFNRTYAATRPHHKDAILASKMCMALSNEVLPKRFRQH